MELHYHNYVSLITTNTTTAILQLNLIAAQGLLPSSSHNSSNLKIYVVAYVDPGKKLKYKISVLDRNNHPSWKDRFILAIDDDLASKRPNDCLLLKIYKRRLFRKDKKIGVAHVLVESLIPENDFDAKLMGFNVRTGSDKNVYGQAILNVGITRLDDVSDSSFLFSHDSDGSMSEKLIPKNSTKKFRTSTEALKY